MRHDVAREGGGTKVLQKNPSAAGVLGVQRGDVDTAGCEQASNLQERPDVRRSVRVDDLFGRVPVGHVHPHGTARRQAHTEVPACRGPAGQGLSNERRARKLGADESRERFEVDGAVRSRHWTDRGTTR